MTIFKDDELYPDLAEKRERRKKDAIRAHSSRTRQAPPVTVVQSRDAHHSNCPECNRLVMLEQALISENDSATGHRAGIHYKIPLCDNCRTPEETYRKRYFYPRP